MKTSEMAPQMEPLLSKRRIGWAGLAALIGCVACCALPLLAAVGLGGGAATAISSVIMPGSELMVGGTAFVAVLGVMAFRSRRAMRQDACGTSCAVDPAGPSGPSGPGALAHGVAPKPVSGGCGCGPSAPKSEQVYESGVPRADEPVACAADLKNKHSVQAGMDEYRAAFTRLVATEHFPGGFRWKFRSEPNLAAQLRSLAEREHECCRFLSFAVAKAGDEIIWETKADAHAAEFLEEYARLPERLLAEPRPGHDLIALKRAAEKAGLTFTADAEGRENA